MIFTFYFFKFHAFPSLKVVWKCSHQFRHRFLRWKHRWHSWTALGQNLQRPWKLRLQHRGWFRAEKENVWNIAASAFFIKRSKDKKLQQTESKHQLSTLNGTWETYFEICSAGLMLFFIIIFFLSSLYFLFFFLFFIILFFFQLPQ